MKRASGAAIVAVAALAIAIGSSIGCGSAVQAGIAYVRGTGGSAPQVWLAGPDGGNPQRLGPGAKPLLAPDGSAVATSSTASSGSALIIYSGSGGAVRRFFHVADHTALAQAWSPDSRYLAVVLSSTNPASAAASGLAVIDAKSGGYRVLAHGPIYGASFAPDGSDRIVYAAAASMSLSASVNIHVVAPDGTGAVRVTSDGRSLNPVWGRKAIAFDRERLRIGAAPAYQVWLMQADGSRRSQVTHLRAPPLLNGLVPTAFSSDGTRLLTEYEGQDTSQAWTLALASPRPHKLMVAGHSVAGAAISRDGSSILVDQGGFLSAPDVGRIESLPFAGGPPRALVDHGSEPSWNL